MLESNPEVSEQNQLLLKEIKKEALEKSILLEVSKRISSSLNVKEVLEIIIDSVKLVIPYDAAGIFLLRRKSKKIYPAVLRGYDHLALKRSQLKVGRGLVGIVAREGKGIVAPDVTRNFQYVDARKATKSEIIVPLIVRNKLLGALNLESDQINAFSEDQLNLLTAFASHAAIAIDNARLHEEVLRSKELEFDLRTARKIQKALLPKVTPKINGYDFATLNIPSKTVSGDFYDLTWLHNCRLGLSIGDVSGKGTPAAILMASIYSSYKRVINESASVAERIIHLNEIMSESMVAGTYTTFFFGELDTEKRMITYCNAGHFPPLIIRKTGETLKLEEGGTVVGFIRDVVYQQASVDFVSGDVLLLYTDGLIEAKNRHGKVFDLENVIQLIQNNPESTALELKEKILILVKKFVGKSYFDDDLTFVLIKIK
ncbi:MAG TPA: GAF domain-containing protein [Bacteroidetes bacterium]|nr:GAF domain-containing protein [Bacteroidota bacterium]